MIRKTKTTEYGLLLDFKYQDAGEFTTDSGEKRKYDAGQKLSWLPIDSNGASINKRSPVSKYTVVDYKVKEIDQILANVHWACFIKITLENSLVIDVEVIHDLMAEVYETEEDLV